jgi:hypothetical protein
MEKNILEKTDSEFIPLRKKAKPNESESNYVNSIYEKSLLGGRMSELDIENLRWYNGIEVKGTY